MRPDPRSDSTGHAEPVERQPEGHPRSIPSPSQQARDIAFQWVRGQVIYTAAKRQLVALGFLPSEAESVLVAAAKGEL